MPWPDYCIWVSVFGIRYSVLGIGRAWPVARRIVGIVYVTSYHNHTIWSDGKATIAEQIAGARVAGLSELGISDHYVMHPGKDVDWSMPLDRLDEYVEDMKRARESASDVIFRIGIEADYFPETWRELAELLAGRPFDYVIGSVHFVDGFPIDESAEEWQSLSQSDVNRVWRRYWELIGEMARTGLYDFAAHLDLPKKFGFRPTVDLTAESDAALDAIASAGMAIEINTAGWYKPVEEAYPTVELLRAARARGIPLLINADAHRVEHLTRDFDRAWALARDAGYSEVARYSNRAAIPGPPGFPPTRE
jgi:histidinol-phosphatase (PHP family)